MSELDKIKERVALAEAQSRLKLLEATSLLFGTAQTSLDLANEDFADPQGEVWDEIGIRGTAFAPRQGMHPVNIRDLQEARNVSRRLVQNNGFAIGALEARISYIVGTGLSWKVVPKDRQDGNQDLADEANEILNLFSDFNDWPDIEQEFVWRADRDGEAFMRFFRGGDGFVSVRFVDPEDVRPPHSREDEVPMGVLVNQRDAWRVQGYYIVEPGKKDASFVPFETRDWVNILHYKSNVDRNSLRGWPTLFPVRRNLTRAQRLLRNMSYVSALQAGIALIRKHDTATSAEATSFVSSNADLLVSNTTTGRNRYHTKILPGTIIDHGPGVTYESPVSSVNPAANVSIIQADLREVASRLQMPEYMLTGSSGEANLASTLVSEAPATKAFERLQVSHARALRHGPKAALNEAVRRGVLPSTFWEDFELVHTSPTVTSRNQLMEAQRHEIEHRNDVLSRRTWRGLAGYDDATENRNLEEEKEENMERAKEMIGPGQGEDEDGMPPGPNPDPRQDDEEVGVPKGRLKESALWEAHGRTNPIDFMLENVPDFFADAGVGLEVARVFSDPALQRPDKVNEAKRIVNGVLPNLAAAINRVAWDEIGDMADAQGHFGGVVARDDDSEIAMSLFWILNDNRLGYDQKYVGVLQFLGSIGRKAKEEPDLDPMGGEQAASHPDA